MRAGSQPLVCGSVGRKSKETATPGGPPPASRAPRKFRAVMLRHLRHPVPPSVDLCYSKSAARERGAIRFCVPLEHLDFQRSAPSGGAVCVNGAV